MSLTTCGKCGAAHAEQLLISKAMAQVDYYRCLLCGHLWTVPEGAAFTRSAPARYRAATLQHDLALLARDNCPCVPDIVDNLGRALAMLGWAADYARVNIGTLEQTDARKGYPSPTLLWHGHDLFGMPLPTLPHAEPG
jgi:hypothetical protein